MFDLEPSNSRTRKGRPVDRRDVLKGLGAVGAVGVLGYGLGELATDGTGADPDRDPAAGGDVDRDENRTVTAGDPPDDGDGGPDDEVDETVRHADAYDRVVDAVTVGADPNGKEPVNDVILDNVAPGTLISFQPGTYRIDPLHVEDVSNFAIAGATEERPTFVGTARACEDRPYVRFQNVGGFLLDGIDVEFSRPGSGGGFRIDAVGDVTVQNVSLSGSCPGQIAAFRLDVIDPDSHGVVRNMNVQNDAKRQLTGVYVGQYHAGVATFENCSVSGFTDNGLYASTPGQDDGGNGPVHVVGGTYTDNNISNVRLGSTGASARGVTVRVDDIPEGYQENARGIRFRNRRDILVEDCSVEFGPNVSNSFGAVVFHGDSEGGTVRDTHIHVDAANVPAIRAFAPNQPDNQKPLIENVTITGDATDDYAARMYNRDGTTFRNCTIKQLGDRRGGIRLKDMDDCAIIDCHIEVDRNPIVARGASILVQNTTIVTPQGTRHIDSATLENGVLSPQ